jgi:hypothetical protein
MFASDSLASTYEVGGILANESNVLTSESRHISGPCRQANAYTQSFIHGGREQRPSFGQHSLTHSLMVFIHCPFGSKNTPTQPIDAATHAYYTRPHR